MSANWQTFLRESTDVGVLIIIDLQYGQKLDASNNEFGKTLPYRYSITAAMLDAGANGFGSQEEANQFYDLEDKLEKFMSTKYQALYVARTRSAGVWRIDFYSAKNKPLKKLEKFFSKNYSPYDFNVSVIDDIDWNRYRELYPDAYELRKICDFQVVNNLSSHGDDLSKARQVDHWIYFGDKQSRTEFIEIVCDMGFQIEDKSTIDELYGLRISRVDHVDLNSISSVIEKLMKLAEHYDAEYDGWETFVVRPTVQ